MASDQPVAPPVTDKPEQGIVVTADGAPVSAQGASGEENAAHDPSAAPPTTTPDAIARAADAEPHPKAAAPSYEDAQGPTEFAQDRARRDEWRQKESEWKRLDKARETARLQFETATRARLADEVEREQGAALEREKTEAVEQERVWWESAMENLAAQHKQEVQRAEAHARRMADERDAAERATQTREEEHARALRQLCREHRADVGRVGDRQAEMQGELRDARRGKAQLQREATGFRDEAQRELDRRVAEVQDHQYPDKIKKLKLRYRRLEQEVESKKDELARERDEIAARWEHEAENLGVQHEQELKEYRHRLDELKRTRREEKEAWKLARAEDEREAEAEARIEAQRAAITNSVRDVIERLSAAKKAAEAELAALRQQNSDLTARLDTLGAMLRQFEADLAGDEGRRAGAHDKDLAQIRQTMTDSVRDVVTNLEQAPDRAEQARDATARDKAELEQKLRRLDHAYDGAADEAHAAAELARYRDAVARALDAHDAGLAQARRAASLAGEPDTLTELGRLVEADCAAIDAVHRQAVAAQGRPGGGAAERERAAARVARIGGELIKIRAIRTRLSLHDALVGALRRQEPPREEGKHGGRGFVAVTPLGVVQAAAFVFFLAAAVAEGHRYSLWSVANATTRSMMAEGSFYTCIGLPPMAYFVDWLLQLLGRRA